MLLTSYKKPLIYKSKGAVGTVTKKYININETRQGLIIESLNEGKPLLLFLHGGPGFSAYPVIKAHDLKLEQFFDVCYWDQRGTGMSYVGGAKPLLTAEQLVDDTIQVVKFLCKTYSQDKVYLLGHSWGTYLGSLVASKRPDLFHAYIGIGQVGSSKASEQETYNFILKTAGDKGDRRAHKQIKNVTFDDMYYKNRAYGAIRAKFTNKYGGGFKHSGYSQIDMLKHVFTCPHYTFKERINIFRGSIDAYQSLGKVMATTDLVNLVTTLQLPVFILQGKYDYQTTWTQASRFFESIQSPHKKMYTFNNSAHSPHIEESHRFYQIISEDILSSVPTIPAQ